MVRITVSPTFKLDTVEPIYSSNTDGSFTMANSNSFLSPYEILPLTQENKYIVKFSYLIMKLYVVCTHYRGDSNEYTQHTITVKEIKNP